MSSTVFDLDAPAQLAAVQPVPPGQGGAAGEPVGEILT